MPEVPGLPGDGRRGNAPDAGHGSRAPLLRDIVRPRLRRAVRREHALGQAPPRREGDRLLHGGGGPMGSEPEAEVQAGPEDALVPARIAELVVVGCLEADVEAAERGDIEPELRT